MFSREKKKIVQKENFCWNCFAKVHVIKKCKSEVRYRIKECNKKHTHLLRTNDNNQNLLLAESTKLAQHKKTQRNSFRQHLNRNKTFLQIIPVTISNRYNSFKTSAVLQTGLDATLIRKDLADKIELKEEEKSLPVGNAF